VTNNQESEYDLPSRGLCLWLRVLQFDVAVPDPVQEIVMFGYWEDGVLVGHDGLTLAHNVSHSNSANGYAVFFGTDVTAVHNHGYDDGESGIEVRSTDDSVFQFSKLFGNGACGIYLARDSASNILYKNKVEANDTGIFADSHAIDNLVVANKARGLGPPISRNMGDSGPVDHAPICAVMGRSVRSPSGFRGLPAPARATV
jgi:parallel beta-helix repeat protein